MFVHDPPQLRCSLCIFVFQLLCCGTFWYHSCFIILSLSAAYARPVLSRTNESILHVTESILAPNKQCSLHFGSRSNIDPSPLFSSLRLNWVEYFNLSRIRFRKTFLKYFVSNFSLEGGNWVMCLWQHHISKMGYFNVPFCWIFVPFHFYLIMTLVVPCLDNIFLVLLISALATIGATKPIFIYSGSPREGRVHACVGMVCYHYIVRRSYTKFK